jgi:DNA-binding NarL/FixJ family response regulator
LEKLKGRGNSIPIVVITMYDAEVFRNRLAPLINSYMQKSDSAAEIIYELQKILL